MKLTPLLACLALAACAVPEAPTLDGSHRQPINDAATVRLLQRGFSVATATTPPVDQSGELQPSGEMSRIFRYHFPVGSAALKLSAREMAELLPVARNAKRIEVRARTDTDEADLNTANRRAVAARRVLIQNGVAPSRISVNSLSGADLLDKNGTPEGRALNRRVEIEVIGQRT
jgi:outer membrane protein OmpA-like peptidoglycan-associated protein